jgi:hypothetical protein
MSGDRTGEDGMGAEGADSGHATDYLQQVIATAIFDEGWTFDGEHGTPAHARHMATVVVRSLGLEEIGWGGVPWDDVDALPAEDFDEAAGLPDGEVWRLDGDDVLIWNPGDWSLRHEDGEVDLLDPWPIYRLRGGSR